LRLQRHWQHWVHKTQDEGKTKQKHNKENYKDEQHGSHKKKPEGGPGTHEV